MVLCSNESEIRRSDDEWRRLYREAIGLASKHSESDRSTWIYFVRCGDAIKIGHTADLEARLRLLRVDNPQEVELVGYIRGTKAGEKAIQRKFAAWRIRGEWFEATDELQDFASLCSLAQENRDFAQETVA